MTAIAACPKYKLGDVVSYRDLKGRTLIGEIVRITADWLCWSKDGSPIIQYSITHPHYRDQRFSAKIEDIVGLADGGAKK